MSTFLAIIQVVVITAAASCRGATNDIEKAIAAFPKILAEEFRPDKAVQSANTLIGAGKAAACAALEEFAKANPEHVSNEKICMLCRLVFTRTNANEFLRPPALGMSQFLPYESLKSPTWPDMPFAVVNDVPLSMNLGYAMAGRREPGVDYLAYCKANGMFRTQPFPKATFLTTSNALSKLFTSAEWKALKWKDEGLGWSYTLDENSAKERLWEQVQNMANQTVQRTGVSRSAGETNRTSSAAGSRR